MISQELKDIDSVMLPTMANKYRDVGASYVLLLDKMGYEAKVCCSVSVDKNEVNCFYVQVKAPKEPVVVMASLSMKDFQSKFDLIAGACEMLIDHIEGYRLLDAVIDLSDDNGEYLSIINDVRMLESIKLMTLSLGSELDVKTMH